MVFLVCEDYGAFPFGKPMIPDGLPDVAGSSIGKIITDGPKGL